MELFKLLGKMNKHLCLGRTFYSKSKLSSCVITHCMIKLVLKCVLQSKINKHSDISAMAYKMKKSFKKYQFGFFIEKFTALKISFEKGVK